MQEALASWHMGRICIAYRHHPFHGPRPLSQDRVAGWLGLTQAQLSRIENGSSIRDLDKLIHWAQTLRIPAQHLWFDLPEERRGLPQVNGVGNGLVVPDKSLLVVEWTPECTESLLEMVSDDGVTVTPALAVRLAHEWLVREPPQVVEIQAGRHIGEGLIRKVNWRLEQLQHMDDFIGGYDLHKLVERELRATIYLLKEATYTEALGKRLLTAIAELCQLAGWVAVDAGLSAAAERYYVSGIHAAHAANDTPLAGNLVSWLSYLYSNAGNPNEAVLLACTAYIGAQDRASATTKALFQQRIGWAYARAGEANQTERALGRADQSYEQRDPADDPNWVYWLSRDEMEAMAARCYIELRMPKRAQPLLCNALDRYDESFAREVSFYVSWLAESYVQTDDIDEAARQAKRALMLSTRVNSARAKGRVAMLRRRLRPYQHVERVREFEELCRELEE
ncbi:MAG: helix-turn-helix domain-containing protein [Egibacteraceae bacterium]